MHLILIQASFISFWVQKDVWHTNDMWMILFNLINKMYCYSISVNYVGDKQTSFNTCYKCALLLIQKQTLRPASTNNFVLPLQQNLFLMNIFINFIWRLSHNCRIIREWCWKNHIFLVSFGWLSFHSTIVMSYLWNKNKKVTKPFSTRTKIKHLSFYWSKNAKEPALFANCWKFVNKKVTKSFDKLIVSKKYVMIHQVGYFFWNLFSYSLFNPYINLFIQNIWTCV